MTSKRSDELPRWMGIAFIFLLFWSGIALRRGVADHDRYERA